MLSELVSGGFYVSRLLMRPAGLQKQAQLPEQLLTLSSCLTGFLPADWALEWSSCSPAERVEAIEELAPKPREGESGLYLRLKSSRPLSDEGDSVGWEPLGVDASGSYHSWLCNGLQDDCLARLGIAPGPLRRLD